MDNFNFLTVVNGVYNFYHIDDDFNLYYNLSVFISQDERTLKIKYKKLSTANEINEGEITLMNASHREISYLLDIFNDNERTFKNIIFNKFLDYFNDDLTFDVII